MVYSRRAGDITPPRSSREGCTLTVKKVSVLLFHGLLDRIFDDCIEGFGCKSKRNFCRYSGESEVSQTFPRSFPLVALLAGTTKPFAVAALTPP
jgi:hypothetical protein